MHSYPSYPPPSEAAVVDLVQAHPFAVVATSLPGAAPVATHLPVVFASDEPAPDSLTGVTMLGHMGRANPHWERFDEHPDALVIFGTSHGYVSPSVYHRTPSAPTLDYATVHARAEVRLLDSRDDAMRVVHATIAALEGQRPEQWDPHDSQELFDRIIDRVVAFTVRITTYDAMFKLSQDMPEDVRGRVREDFRAGPCEHPDLADLMDSMERMEQAR